MVKITINDNDLDEIKKGFKQTKAELKKINKELSKSLPGRIKSFLQQETNKDTGATAQSWKVEKKSNGFSIINTRGGIIDFLFSGVKPHIIEPNNKSVLSFDAGGSKLFVKVVSHPGFPKQMDERQIFNKIMQMLEKEINIIITKAFTKL